jgi:hypothetical protein
MVSILYTNIIAPLVSDVNINDGGPWTDRDPCEGETLGVRRQRQATGDGAVQLALTPAADA